MRTFYIVCTAATFWLVGVLSRLQIEYIWDHSVIKIGNCAFLLGMILILGIVVGIMAILED